MAKNHKQHTVRVKRINWDVEYLKDIITNNGFTITEPAVVKLDDTKQKSLYGARSILYGTNYEDENAFIERYRCQCGEFKGKLFEGETCPLCGTEGEYQGTNIEFTGWISLGGNYILNPFYYQKLASCMKKGMLDSIINEKYQVDVNGNRTRYIDPDEQAATGGFAGIGLVEFREHFEEIIEFAKMKKKGKTEELDRLLSEKSSVFTSHIPIYSTLLRPQSATTDTYYFNTIDKHVNPLFTLSEKLKGSKEIDRAYILSRIQSRVNKLWATNFEFITGKDGWIRGQILGGALNYTSRNVIIPNPELRDSEVDLSYNTFLELFKFKIIHYLMVMDDISLTQAWQEYQDAYKFNPHIYEVMNFIIAKEQPRILINRNPTLNYYSILLMKVRKVKKDVTDFTLSVPLSVLPGLNADFDGDILNIIGIMNKELEHAFRKFDPVTRMIISRDSGLLNPYFMIEKSQMIDFYNFCTL